MFWLIYAVYLMIAFGGMTVTAQLGPIARDFGVDKRMVTLLGFSLPLLTMTVSIDNLANGLTRPFSGYLSDRIGRENAMLLMFSAEGVGVFGDGGGGRNPLAFVVFAALIFSVLGRDFLALPGDLRRHLRSATRDGQQRAALYRQGNVGAGGPVGEFSGCGDGELDSGAAVDGGFERGRGDTGAAVLAPMRRRMP